MGSIQVSGREGVADVSRGGLTTPSPKISQREQYQLALADRLYIK